MVNSVFSFLSFFFWRMFVFSLFLSKADFGEKEILGTLPL